MGFWSSVWGGIKSCVKKAAGFIAKKIPIIGDWIYENILGLDEAPSYNPKSATIDETKKINELLEKCISSYSKEAGEYDEFAKKIIEEQFFELKNKLTEINTITGEKIIDDYIFKSFDNNLKYINKDLDKIYSKQISNVFSLNNSKLLEILDSDKGREKKNRLRDLAINTITNANNTLFNTLSKFIKEQQEFISTKLDAYMKNRKNESIAAQKETENILKSVEKDNAERIKLEKIYDEKLKKLDLLNEILTEEIC